MANCLAAVRAPGGVHRRELETGHVRWLRARSGHAGINKSAVDHPMMTRGPPDLRLLRERATGIEPAWPAWKLVRGLKSPGAIRVVQTRQAQAAIG